MYRLVILFAYLRTSQTMSPITKYLLTPVDGEACGYQSCHPIVKEVLNIHIIPHTHAELGYTRTFDNHFTGRDEFYDKSNINMKRILDYVISELWADQDRRFAFADLPYLYKWWTIRDGTVKRMVYQLIRQGRLQIVGGGWSMTDESTATYQAIIDQFTYSLRKINATFLDCARPTVTWQSDVFGHTNEFASLMAQMGFDGHFINPISFDDELERMRSKRLEFVWRGSPDLGASSEIFTHKLFDGYWSPPGFCFGGQCGDPLIVDSNTAFNNVQERVKLFVEAMQYRQGPHYAGNHLLVVMGQRFGYYDAPLWFENIDKLIRNVNQYVGTNEKNMILYYSTPACYLKAIHESNVSFTVEADDFVPVAYDRNTHFSGMFSSRPTVKYATREGNLYLQITKQLQVLARLGNNDKFFEDFHWIMGVLQDHSILTGGMRPIVRDYYINKIHNTLISAERIIRDGLVNLMKSPKIEYKRCLLNISYCEYTDRENYHIVIYNPLAWNVTYPVRLPVNEGRFTVFLPNLIKVQSVIMKIPQSIQAIPYKRRETYDFELVFIAEDVPALGYRSYFIEKITRMKRSVHSDNHSTKIREDNDESGDFDDHLSENGVKNDKNDEIGDSDDHLSDYRDKNDILVDNDNYEDKNRHKIMHSFNLEDHFSNDRGQNDDIDTIIYHLNDKKENINNPITRKTRSINFNTHLIDKNDRLDDINYHLSNDREGDSDFVRLSDVRNLNTKVYDSKVEKKSNTLRKPNVTRIIKFKKGFKANDNLKRIFESINDNEDNFELDVVFGDAKAKQNNIETNKNTKIFDLNKSSKDFIRKYGYGSEKYDDDVTKYNLDSKIESTTSNSDNITTKIDSNDSNNTMNVKTNINKEKYNKNNNTNMLKGIKRCNCKISRLKQEQNIEKKSEEAAKDIVNEVFGNKTLKFIHFKQDQITQEQNPTKAFKREVKNQKQKRNKIKQLKNGIKKLKLKIKTIKQNKEPKEPKEDVIKDLIREINKLRRDILVINTKTNETRPERSVFKKIKSAKKTYLRRQTNNLKIDDESLLDNDHPYDDDDYVDDDDDYDNTTEANERYVFEHVTDYSDYVITPNSRHDSHIHAFEDTTSSTTTTEEATTEETTTTTRATRKPDPVISTLYSDTTDSYISNEYINITTDIHKNISFVALANGLTMALNINFYYFASDDPMKMGRPDYKKPGAFVFRPMDPEPVFIVRKPKLEVYKSNVVEEIHSNSNLASFIIRLYRNAAFFEVEWIVRGIPISDGIGKDLFIRYSTDLETNGVFYTDANGRQTIKRVFGHRPMYKQITPDTVPGNYYPVTSKITIEDPSRLIRFSVFNDRTQGGTSFNGEIDLMLNRRILTDDGGFQAFINETENEVGTTVSGKHYIYITKLNTKINKIFEKKLAKEISLRPQIFLPTKMVGKQQWEQFRNEFYGVNKIPIGLNILTLQEWNDGSFLIRIENYLEKSDVLKSGIKKIILKDIFTVFSIIKVKETTLDGNIFKQDFIPISWKKKTGNTEHVEPFSEVKIDEEILFKPQEIRTFVVWVQFH